MAGIPIVPYNPRQPGNAFHFWDVTLDAGAVGPTDWIATGFNSSAQLSDLFSVDGLPRVEVGGWIIQFNSATLDAIVPGYTYYNDDGVLVSVGGGVGGADRIISVGPAGAWRVVKNDVGAGTGGTVRVMVGSIPGDLAT